MHEWLDLMVKLEGVEKVKFQLEAYVHLTAGTERGLLGLFNRQGNVGAALSLLSLERCFPSPLNATLSSQKREDGCEGVEKVKFKLEAHVHPTAGSEWVHGGALRRIRNAGFWVCSTAKGRGTCDINVVGGGTVGGTNKDTPCVRSPLLARHFPSPPNAILSSPKGKGVGAD
ncbi:hypothetical protein VNO78_09206 [Psophocarpus tetragonolobus]|uniref:Uncharacterized protein n=1 Tax=Psophocarpus tetragonolobus TaxID=3891 RepID=A0AAN9T6E5_PSOTE